MEDPFLDTSSSSSKASSPPPPSSFLGLIETTLGFIETTSLSEMAQAYRYPQQAAQRPQGQPRRGPGKSFHLREIRVFLPSLTDHVHISSSWPDSGPRVLGRPTTGQHQPGCSSSSCHEAYR